LNKKNKISLTYLCIYTVIIFLLFSCANIVAPSGGAVDSTPPKPIRSIPANYSILFNKDKIEILFDEFILLKDLKNQLIISPPLTDMPDVSVKGKTLIIKIEETLKENTTYTFFFGDAIIDLTEGNAISSYEFVFSTGSMIDSMTIKGKIVDAFTQKPEKDFFVMLYKNANDSLPYNEKPYYLTKTKENGEFAINNLRNIPYKIFALKDANNNLKFDQAVEKIAFSDTLVIPDQKPVIKVDSSLKDSLQKDSLMTRKKTEKQHLFYELRSFQEVDSTQRLLKAAFIKKGELMFAFRYPVKNLKINLLDKFEVYNWKIEEWNKAKDTLIYWILKPDMDTINMIVNDNNQLIDTLNLRLKQKIVKAPMLDTLNTRLKQKNTKTTLFNIPKVVPTTNLLPIFDFYKNISFTFPNPILRHDSMAVLLIESNDTIKTYAYSIDAVHRKFQIKKELKQAQEYKLIVKEDVITDIFGLNNDSIVVNFKTNSAEEKGCFILNLNLKDSVNNYIIQLLNESEVVMEQRFIDKSTKLKFKYLNPGNYQIKAIIDINHNQKWDTGSYLKNIQPEKVEYFPAKILIRENWDMEENWDL